MPVPASAAPSADAPRPLATRRAPRAGRARGAGVDRAWPAGA